MGVKLREIDTVAVGRFNPHIVSPQWLVKEGVISSAVTVETKIAISNRTVAFRFTTGHLSWQVDYGRLVVSTETTSDTAAIVAKVVQKLPHTPLTAIGNNFRYGCNSADWKGRLPKLDDVGADQLVQYGEVQTVSWNASINRPDGSTVNVEVSVDPTELPSPMLTVSVNYHRQVGNAEDLVAAAQRFEEDQRASATFLESLLREKVEQ